MFGRQLLQKKKEKLLDGLDADANKIGVGKPPATHTQEPVDGYLSGHH
jgi:hypothetical protein